MSDAQNEIINTHLATKLDILSLDHKIDKVETDLQHKIDTVEKDLHHKIDQVEKDLKADIAVLDSKIDKVEINLTHKFDKLTEVMQDKFYLLYWMLGFSLSMTAAILFKPIL